LAPYAFSPPALFEAYSKASLLEFKSQIINSLGQLYAVPPDNRLPLQFEKNQLRLASERGELVRNLHDSSEFFDALHKAGGFFQVTDYDDFMNFAEYEPAMVRQHPRDSHGFPAGPALAAEELRLNIPHGKYVLDLSHGTVPKMSGIALPRRWHRLVHLQGLAHMSSIRCVRTERGALEINLSRVWNLLFRDDDRRLELQRDVKEMLHLHMNCGSRQQSYNPYKDNWNAFHVIWYRTLRSVTEGMAASKTRPKLGELSRIRQRLGESSWKSGVFFDNSTQFQQSAFTLGICPDGVDEYNLPREYDMHGEDLLGRIGFYWTYLLLTPIGMESPDFSIPGLPHIFPLCIIATAFKDAANSWEQVARHLTELLSDDDDAVLHPERHDQLLFDDSTFSRSRRYFWAADIMDTFQDAIENLLNQWEYWREAWEPRLRLLENIQTNRLKERESDEDGKPHPDYKVSSLENYLRLITFEVDRIKQIKADLNKLATKTKTLREGVSAFSLCALSLFVPLSCSHSFCSQTAIQRQLSD
jgi:hypothetical protein